MKHKNYVYIVMLNYIASYRDDRKDRVIKCFSNKDNALRFLTNKKENACLDEENFWLETYELE